MISRRDAVAGLLGTMAVPALAAAPAASSPQTGGGFRYETALTAGAAADERLPIVLALHFFSGTPAMMLGWLSKLNVKARIVAPYGKVAVDDGYAWWPEAAEKGVGGAELAIRLAAESLARFIDALLERHPTVGLPVAVGLSHGGDLSFALARRHPDKVGAAAPIGARLLTTLAPSSLPSPPLRKIDAFQGETDQIVPAAPNIRAVEGFRQSGAPVRLHLVPGVGHALPAALAADVRDTIESRIREMRGC